MTQTYRFIVCFGCATLKNACCVDLEETPRYRLDNSLAKCSFCNINQPLHAAFLTCKTFLYNGDLVDYDEIDIRRFAKDGYMFKVPSIEIET